LRLPQPRPSVIYKDLPEGAILFCPQTEVYYSLNSIGVNIWRLLPPVCTTDAEIVARLTQLHPDVDISRIETDVRRLLVELVQSGLADSSTTVSPQTQA
jgi:hypothetical protein